MSSTRFSFSLTLFAGLLGLALSQDKCHDIEKHTDYYGSDIGSEPADSVDHCCDICAKDDKCKYFTYDLIIGKCYKKTSSKGSKQYYGRTSGASPKGPGPSPGPSPPTPPPSPGHGPCAKSYDNVVKAGHCSKPNHCPDHSYIGKWSVYAVPCDDEDSDELYKWDEGWGGAHITMTSFQAMSQKDAWKLYNKTKESLHPTQPFNWQPKTFKAIERKDGLREIGIDSKNLDAMTGILKYAGWDSPTQKGDWHVTVSDLDHKPLKKGSATYNSRTHLFASHHWALVLVECFKDDDGDLAFHRQSGFQLVEWLTKATDAVVV